MKNRNNILIIVSVVVLLALSAIQGHLIFNTYELERKSFIREVDEALTGIDHDSPLDSLYTDWGTKLLNNLSDMKNERYSRAEVLTMMAADIDSISEIYNATFLLELKKLDLEYDVSYKKKLKHVVLFENELRDTIFPSKYGREQLIFGFDFDETDAQIVNKSTWYTNHEYISMRGESISNQSFDLQVRTNSLILIEDWRGIVFKRMFSLLFLSVLLFLFVAGLLYYSIRNLIDQKRITDVKTDFINNITHELKTPLATLSIASKSLRNKDVQGSPEALDNTLSIVDRQNQRLQKLIDQVLNNSLSADEIILNKESIPDNVYFSELVEDFKLSTQNEGLRLRTEIYAPEVLLRVDRFHFTTALLNILENAVKYGQEDTEIDLKTSIKNGDYIIEISDNGVGISEKDQRNLFEKFYRVTKGNRHDVKGLGLGLYLAQQICKAHQGSITVQSELRTGTIFTIHIPVN